MNDAAQTNPAAFAPEAVGAINRAYDEACGIAGEHSGKEDLRLKLAEHIMFLARNGETDEHRLCSLALLAVTGRSADHGDSRDGSATPDIRNGGMPPAASPGATGVGPNLKPAR